MTSGKARIWIVEEKSPVEVRRKDAKALGLRAVFMIWPD